MKILPFKRSEYIEVEAKPIGGTLTTYLSIFTLVDPCLSIPLTKLEKDGVKISVRRYLVKSGDRTGRVLIAVGQPSKILEEMKSFTYECGPSFPAELFLRSLAEIRKIVNRFARTFIVLGYLPIPSYIPANPKSCKLDSEVIPPPDLIDRCIPPFGDVRVCSLTNKNMDLLATSRDERFVHVAYAVAVVKTLPVIKKLTPFGEGEHEQ